jgi:hypothetical protein
VARDSIHDDNTGHGGSVEFMERRKRGESLVASWGAEGVRPGRREAFDSPAAESFIAERAERSSMLSNLRSRLNL